jgi:hypothetical protein
MLVAFAPVLVACAVAGVVNGLAARERVGAGAGYSSPLKAWIAKRLAAGAGIAIASVALAPIPSGGAILWASAAGLLAGSAGYVGNLPTRL